jgi:competence protein ComEC
MPGAVVRMPAMPPSAYALIIAGGLWVALWRSRMRWWGVVPAALGVGLAVLAPVPDLLVSRDGRHVAIRQDDGRLAYLRPRAGGFLRDMWGDAVASAGDIDAAALPGVACGQDSCVARVVRDGRQWRLLMTLSRDFIDRELFEPACTQADIVVSDRRLPRWCEPRWLKLDSRALADSGAVTIDLGRGRVVSANAGLGDHPWRPVGD